MVTAFQRNAFQNNAFQIDVDANSGLLGGKAYFGKTFPGTHTKEYSYLSPYVKYESEQYELAKKYAKAKELADEIALAETRKKEVAKNLLDAKESKRKNKAVKQLMALEATLQDGINVLRIQREQLMRFIQEEEAILVILLSSPFN